jgi:hypothetical protein
MLHQPLKIKLMLTANSLLFSLFYTGKKEKKIFLIYKETQNRAVAESCTYEEGLSNL